MNTLACLLPYVGFGLFILLLIIDQKSHQAHIKRIERKQRAKKEAEKRKKPKELKWPENLPRHDL
jgi:hypothetical protein